MDNSFDPEKMNNIKNLVDNGNLSEAISQISPEMIENFSKLMNNNTSQNSNTSVNNNTYNSNASSNTSNNSSNFSSSGDSSNSGFDFGNIDMNTVLKMKSFMEKNKNDPRSNLLYSLKPYLRQNKQEKLDQYVNLLNFSKVADILNNNKKGD